MNDVLEGTSSSQQDNGDSGSDSLITYLRSHCNPEVELFSANMLNEWIGSAEKARDDPVC